MAGTKALIATRVARLLAEFADEPFALYRSELHMWRSVGEVQAVIDDALAAVEPDAPIAVVLRQRPNCLAATISLWASGRCVTLLSPLRPDRALADEIADLRPAAVLADGEDWLRAGLAEASSAAVCVDLGDGSGGSAAMLRHVPAVAPALPSPPSIVAATITTSGTTGPPKRYAITWEDLSPGTVPRDPVRDRGVIINALPLFSIGGVLAIATTIFAGRPIALMDRFDVLEWAGLIRDHRPRRAGAPPAVLQMVLDAGVPPSWLESVESLYTASAPLPMKLAEAFETTYGVPIVQGYGATEFLGGVTGWPGDLHARYGQHKRGSVGRALAGVELRVVDRVTGEVLAPDVVGGLDVKSARRAQGVPDGWVATNDLARIDDDGFVWILGRSDDVIIRGGFKVALGEVEAALLEHPGVREACVIGIPDERLGEVPAALVVAAGEELPEGELITTVRDRLAAYMIPVLVVVRSAMPLNAMMKRDRTVIASLLRAELADRRQRA